VQFSTVVNQSIWPEISYAFSVGDNQLVRKMIRYALRFSLPIACVMGALIVVFGGSIFDVWSGRKADYSATVMLVLIVGALTHVAWQVYWVAMMATASYSAFAVVFMLVSMVSVLAVFLPGSRLRTAGCLLCAGGHGRGVVLSLPNAGLSS